MLLLKEKKDSGVTTSERSRNLAQGQEFATGKFLTLGCNSRKKQRPQRGRVSQLIASSQSPYLSHALVLQN